ncbi:FAD-dependent oxidoreductase [Flavobacterium sp. NRK F10]|uniref:FAD-dependent oxidoreductase n=1 Tax=Flavobacterium sp. NRK F10 TaxID=2954931 RepID=UPI002090DB71|nr:FAD-dependent oxidoreductase [Flavobacterium sp. NRK F10]MCO6174517.1 FAD-dependent oxidoreductase [Flavobacterium sp. NRK F10]
MFDVLIIGAGVSGVSCALILGSAKNKPFATDKKIGIIAHQKASSLQTAVFNNAYGIPPGKLGSEILSESLAHLGQTYPHVEQISGEKVTEIKEQDDFYIVVTNKGQYKSKVIVVAIGAGNPISLEGLDAYIEPHQKIAAVKNKIQLKNNDHLVKQGLYVSGVLAGHRSQLSIAAGSGAAVGTDILTLWNEGNPTVVHDAVNK